MNYKIRFENLINGTAPAQRVFITSDLDSDLDYRTFRLGPFGFGNFTYEPLKSSPIIQVTLYSDDKTHKINFFPKGFFGKY